MEALGSCGSGGPSTDVSGSSIGPIKGVKGSLLAHVAREHGHERCTGACGQLGEALLAVPAQGIVLGGRRHALSDAAGRQDDDAAVAQLPQRRLARGRLAAAQPHDVAEDRYAEDEVGHEGHGQPARVPPDRQVEEVHVERDEAVVAVDECGAGRRERLEVGHTVIEGRAAEPLDNGSDMLPRECGRRQPQP
eukprot:scaffold106864_cov75-Phaeocystis_antarctica.AAC.5